MIRPLSSLLLALAAAGCVAPDLQQRYDALLRDRDELRRARAGAEAELMACRARCEAAEAPAPAPGAAPGLDDRVGLGSRDGETVIGIPGDVFFASGSSALNREGERAMEGVAAYLRERHPEGTIRVAGHSDSDPIRATKSRYHCNWELSFERAHAVLHHLAGKGGLDPRRLACEARGEHQPLDPSDKSRNRRVEIVVRESIKESENQRIRE